MAVEQNQKVQVNLTELNTIIVGFCELLACRRTILCTSFYVFYDPHEGYHNNRTMKLKIPSAQQQTLFMSLLQVLQKGGAAIGGGGGGWTKGHWHSLKLLTFEGKKKGCGYFCETQKSKNRRAFLESQKAGCPRYKKEGNKALWLPAWSKEKILDLIWSFQEKLWPLEEYQIRNLVLMI